MEGFVERHFECVWVADGKYIRGREAVGEEGKYVSGSVESSAEIDGIDPISRPFGQRELKGGRGGGEGMKLRREVHFGCWMGELYTGAEFQVGIKERRIMSK